MSNYFDAVARGKKKQAPDSQLSWTLLLLGKLLFGTMQKLPNKEALRPGVTEIKRQRTTVVINSRNESSKTRWKQGNENETLSEWWRMWKTRDRKLLVWLWKLTPCGGAFRGAQLTKDVQARAYRALRGQQAWQQEEEEVASVTVGRQQLSPESVMKCVMWLW